MSAASVCKSLDWQELQRRYGALEEACSAKERESQRLMKATKMGNLIKSNYIYIICFCFLVDIQSLFLSLFQIYIIWDVLFNQPCGPGWGRQAMENRHNEATDQLSKLYQRKLSHESDRHLAPV